MPRLAVIARDPLPIREVVEKWLPDGVAVERFLGSELSLEQIFTHLNGGDLFGSQQAFWYQDCIGFKAGPKDLKRLAEMLADVPDHVFLATTHVLEFEQEWEEGKKLKTQAYSVWLDGVKYQDLRKVSTPEQAPKWLIQRAQERYGLRLTVSQAQRLLAVSDDRLVLADTELGKLALLKTSDALQPVPDKLLDGILSTNPAAEFYALADAITTGARDSIHRLQVWFKETQDTYRLLFELRARLLAMRDQAAGAKLLYFQQSKIQNCARCWRQPAIDTAVLAVARTEFALKSGQYTGLPSKDAELAALELLTRDIAQALKA